MKYLKIDSMSDDKNKKDYRDRTRINVNEPHEVQYWTERFEVSAEKLKQAVETAGPMVADVQKELKGK